MPRTNGDSQAFPSPDGDGWLKGLSKREYIAAYLMGGFLEDAGIAWARTTEMGIDKLARSAVMSADALLEALEDDEN